MVVCFATRLGHRKNFEGQEIVVEFAHTKPEMIATLSARRPLEAIDLDRGEIPGDHMGAGGLDSTFHAHMKSSWKGKKRKLKSDHRKSVKQPTAVPTLKKVSSVTRRQPNVLSYKAMVRERRLPKTKHTRTIPRRPIPPRNRTVFYDDTDKRAISMMKTLRVTWTAEEDNLLLLCRIATMYFNGKSKKQYVNSHTIRDILHFHLGAVHKTSKACMRRIVYMMRNPTTKTSVESCLCEIQENEMIRRRYGENFVENLKNFYTEEELHSAIKHHFINLVTILNQMFYRLSLQGLSAISRKVPDTVEAFWTKFRETNPEKAKLRYVDPVTHDDIVISSIYLLFHSSMCTTKDKAPYNLQLFEIYRNYSNEILTRAMTSIHKDQLISCWKAASKSKAKKVIPMQAGAYHLSQVYQNQIIQHVPYCIYEEMRQLFVRHSDAACVELVGNVNGACYLFGELLSQHHINLLFELPKKLLVFSNSTPTDRPYERISSRFHSILSHAPKLEIDDSQERKQKPQKKVACAPDHDVFIYRQYAFERWMKLQSPESHVFCFLRHAKYSLESIHSSSFDEICSYQCLFQDNDLTDFLGCIDSITQSDGRSIEKLLDIFTQITEKIDRRDVKDLGRTRCRRVSINLEEILRDLIDETSEDQSKWVTEFYQTDGDEAEDAIPNTWQIRQDLDANSNIDDFSEKSKRFDNYLTLREVKLSFDIKPTAPGVLDEGAKETILTKVRQSSILINPTKSLEMILVSFGGSLEHSARRIIDAIIECQQFGTTYAALERRFPEINNSNLIYILETFLQESIVITIGIVEYHLVFWKYAQPWLIKTFNLTRLEQEAEGATVDLDAPSTSQQCKEEPPAKRPRFSGRAPSITVRSVEALKEQVKGKDREFFYLRPYPWIRVNGTLNRRVLDKWMGSVLIYLTKNPGISVTHLAERFTFLHPTHLRLLLEILEDLQCIQLITVKAPKATLRSTYQSPEIEISHKLAPFDRTVIEILSDALMRYTAFIGERKYRADFI